jgi:hypothetical protein
VRGDSGDSEFRTVRNDDRAGAEGIVFGAYRELGETIQLLAAERGEHGPELGGGKRNRKAAKVAKGDEFIELKKRRATKDLRELIHER